MSFHKMGSPFGTVLTNSRTCFNHIFYGQLSWNKETESKENEGTKAAGFK